LEIPIYPLHLIHGKNQQTGRRKAKRITPHFREERREERKEKRVCCVKGGKKEREIKIFILPPSHSLEKILFFWQTMTPNE
jgi:hypothetical protein